jgi:hypothetical protein
MRAARRAPAGLRGALCRGPSAVRAASIHQSAAAAATAPLVSYRPNDAVNPVIEPTIDAPFTGSFNPEGAWRGPVAGAPRAGPDRGRGWQARWRGWGGETGGCT